MQLIHIEDDTDGVMLHPGYVSAVGYELLEGGYTINIYVTGISDPFVMVNKSLQQLNEIIRSLTS